MIPMESFLIPLRKEHSYIHSGITDAYICQFCGQSFRFGSSLSAHRMRYHALEMTEAKKRLSELKHFASQKYVWWWRIIWSRIVSISCEFHHLESSVARYTFSCKTWSRFVEYQQFKKYKGKPLTFNMYFYWVSYLWNTLIYVLSIIVS